MSDWNLPPICRSSSAWYSRRFPLSYRDISTMMLWSCWNPLIEWAGIPHSGNINPMCCYILMPETGMWRPHLFCNHVSTSYCMGEYHFTDETFNGGLTLVIAIFDDALGKPKKCYKLHVLKSWYHTSDSCVLGFPRLSDSQWIIRDRESWLNSLSVLLCVGQHPFKAFNLERFEQLHVACAG